MLSVRPSVFSPIFAGRELDAEALVGPWLIASVISLSGIAVVLCVRPDPKRIAELIAPPRPDHLPEPPSAPLRQIAINAGLEGGVVAEKVAGLPPGHGLNATTGQYVDMIEAGIIEPTKVTRSALQNAASVAGLFLTTEVLIAHMP